MPSVGLIKAANACLKRVLGAVKKHGKCDCAKDASQLDNLVERLYEVSPAVDEVVLSVYPPVNKEVVHENVSNNLTLHDCFKTVIVSQNYSLECFQINLTFYPKCFLETCR